MDVEAPAEAPGVLSRLVEPPKVGGGAMAARLEFASLLVLARRVEDLAQRGLALVLVLWYLDAVHGQNRGVGDVQLDTDTGLP